MAKKVHTTVALVAFMVIGAIFAPSASAFGQCGGSVSTGSQLFQEWQNMGVTSQAAQIAKSAGFHRMDGSFKKWMAERVVSAKLAATASPEDFGCNPGTVFSVGPRSIAKGTQVMVALPLKFAKSDVRTTPHKGFKRIVVSVRVVGKTDCSNPLSGVVRVVIYVKAPKHKPKPKHHKKHKKRPPSCEAQGLITVAGNCVRQSNNAEQNCKDSGGTWNSVKQQCVIIQINANCSNVTVVNGSGNTVETYQEGNCNTKVEQPPAPPPPTHFVQVSCQVPQHLFVNDSAYMYCVATNDNQALISLNVFGDSFATVAGQKSVNVRNQAGDPCPSGAQCFRETVQAGSKAGQAQIVAKATSNGAEATWKGAIPIVEDNFGT